MVRAQPFAASKMAFSGLVFLLSALVGAGSPAAAQGAAEGIRLRDGVVVDAGKGLVYTMKPGGGVEATAISSGQVAWTNEAVARPLRLAGGSLLAQREGAEEAATLELAWIDGATGELRTTFSGRLPAPMRTNIDDGLGRQFEIGAAQRPEGLAIAFKSTVQQIRGADLDDELEGGDAPRISEGAATLDLAGNWTPASSFAIEGASPLRLAPAASRIAGGEGEQYLSADGRHLLVSRRIADNRVWNRWRWRVYEVGSGKALGQIDQPVSIAPFLVVGDILLFESRPSQHVLATHDLIEEPLALRAFSLGSGRERWVREIRDTTYYGPYPP